MAQYRLRNALSVKKFCARLRKKELWSIYYKVFLRVVPKISFRLAKYREVYKLVEIKNDDIKTTAAIIVHSTVQATRGDFLVLQNVTLPV